MHPFSLKRTVPGINTVPWVFSPDVLELKRQAGALRRANVQAVRFNFFSHRSWFKAGAHRALTHLGKVVEALLSQRIYVLFTLCTWNERMGVLAGSDDPGDITRAMFRPFNNDPTATLKVPEVVSAWREDIQNLLTALGTLGRNTMLYAEVWNGGEGWQEVYHNWRVTDPGGVLLLEAWENLVKDLVPFPVLGSSAPQLRTVMQHWYKDAGGFYRTPIPEHVYGKKTGTQVLYVTECGVYRSSPQWETAGPEEWVDLASRVTKSKAYFILSFHDGRFRELTYDLGSTMALWNAEAYQQLVTDSGKGIPLLDGWIVEGSKEPWRSVFRSHFGIDPYHLNLS